MRLWQVSQAIPVSASLSLAKQRLVHNPLQHLASSAQFVASAIKSEAPEEEVGEDGNSAPALSLPFKTPIGITKRRESG